MNTKDTRERDHKEGDKGTMRMRQRDNRTSRQRKRYLTKEKCRSSWMYSCNFAFVTSAAARPAAGCTFEGDPFGSATSIASRVPFAGVAGRRRDIVPSHTISQIPSRARDENFCVEGLGFARLMI